MSFAQEMRLLSDEATQGIRSGVAWFYAPGSRNHAGHRENEWEDLSDVEVPQGWLPRRNPVPTRDRPSG